jgi:hypothetical protein
MLALIKKLSLGLLLSFSLSQAAALEPIYETEDTLYISIYGDQVSSMDDIHNLFIKALNFPASYVKTFKDLETHLSNPIYAVKKIDITIYSGGSLRTSERLGEQTLETLLEVLNNAENNNRTKEQLKNIQLFYWN